MGGEGWTVSRSIAFLLVLGVALGFASPAKVEGARAPDIHTPDWALEGSDGPRAEYIYPTGSQGEAGYPVGWDFGQVGMLATSTCAQLEYYLKVYRINSSPKSPISGNYATRPAHAASTPPPTPYLVTGQ